MSYESGQKRKLDIGGASALSAAPAGGMPGSHINPLSGRPFSAKYYEILAQRQRLPVWEQRDDFMAMVKKNQTIVLVGETGSGKTTQIPSLMLEAGISRGRKLIACTQPRRVAAMSVSTACRRSSTSSWARRWATRSASRT
jgi:pre-mRNA-splicing factor ATP-dependent RNA helicase DHX15/PRP43